MGHLLCQACHGTLCIASSLLMVMFLSMAPRAEKALHVLATIALVAISQHLSHCRLAFAADFLVLVIIAKHLPEWPE